MKQKQPSQPITANKLGLGVYIGIVATLGVALDDGALGAW